jgi:hypothetical protein
MEVIVSWISAHWSDVLAVYGAAVGLATVVVKLTPTQEDDAILAKIVGAVEWLSHIKK